MAIAGQAPNASTLGGVRVAAAVWESSDRPWVSLYGDVFLARGVASRGEAALSRQRAEKLR